MKRVLRAVIAIPVVVIGCAGLLLGLAGLGFLSVSLKLLEAIDRLD